MHPDQHCVPVDDSQTRRVPFVVIAHSSAVMAMDRTDADADKQATIMLALISAHGRATPFG